MKYLEVSYADMVNEMSILQKAIRHDMMPSLAVQLQFCSQGKKMNKKRETGTQKDDVYDMTLASEVGQSFDFEFVNFENV